MTITEKILLSFGAFVLLLGCVLSFTHPDFFATGFSVEDGPTEWATVVFLLAAMVWCASRVVSLRGLRPGLFIFTYCVLTLLFFFGAGEEVSWGQRILGVESSEFFQKNNAQGETNLHNLVVGDTKINKLIFGTGLALVLLIYLVVLTPLYWRNERVRQFLRRFGVPIPRLYHIVCYVVLLVVVELIMEASRKGEMTEVVGAIIVYLNLRYPANAEIFNTQLSKDDYLREN